MALVPARMGLGAATGARRERFAVLARLDPVLIGAAFALAGLGVLVVFSATRAVVGEQGQSQGSFLARQVVFLGLGLLVMALVTAIDYRLLRAAAPVLYGAALVLLVLVVSPVGTEVNGSQSWFAFGSFQLQPSELAKVAVILALAAFCATHHQNLNVGRIGVCLMIVGVPTALIFLQPDVGSMLVFVAVIVGMLLVAGARPRHLVALTLVGVVGVIGVFELDLIKDYQKERLTSFAQEGTTDPQKTSFQIDQSKTAIGAGGVTGAGLFNGTQTRLQYVPEQQTDFVFTVVAEELGFLGSATLLLLYALLVWRIWRTARTSADLFGTLICVGVLSMLLFQVFENVGMTMGIMPITGIPLPLISYGGSSTIAAFAALGLVANVHLRRYS